jgi:hypothetical protein
MSNYAEEVSQLFDSDLKWDKTDSPLYPYKTIIDRFLAKIRVNMDPEHPESFLYTLEIGGTDVHHFDSFPNCWDLPE